MNPDPPKGGNTYDATQRAMRFLKGNPAPEENKEGETPPKDKGANAGPRERVYAGNLPYDFRRPMAYDQMATDRFGEELAPDAAIWNMYLDEAQEHDRELVEGRQRSLDTLLLFAALFSAILTAFLIESKNLLQQDPADAATELLLIIARSQQRVELGLPVPEGSTEIVDIPEFTPSLYARWINGIWFMSLALSLSAALIAMLGKEWLTTFYSSRPRSTRRLAFIRQARLKGLEDWGALHIIALLPTLLHSSLLLFSVGLVIYLWALDAALAGVLTGVIGVTLAFYVVTGILGAVYEFCPFVTEVSQYTQRAFKAIFRLPSRDQNGDYVMPSFQDLQALVWLSKQAGDPVVVDYAYQAIAGLHHSPYVVSDTVHARPNLSSTTMIPDEATLFGQDITMNSLLLKVEERFDDLLAGTLETGSVEPPVCRYMNAIIALASYAERSSDSPLVHWLGILDRIDRVWGSSLPPKSLSGSNFAGVLIAEMDVLKMAMELLRPMIPASNLSLVEKGSLAEAESVNTSRSHLPQHEGRIELYRSNMDISKATSDTFSRLKSRLAEWLEVSLALLRSQTSGETNIDPYLVTGLLRATTDAARYLDRIHPVLRSQKLIAKAPESRDDSLDPLQILVNILSQPASTRSESIVQLTEVLKTYSSLAPMLLQPLKKKDGAYLRSAFAFQDLNSNPPSSRREVLAIIVRYMMISAGYLSDLLRQIPECRQIFGDALELVFTLAEEGGGYYEPRTAIGYHVGELIRVLEFFAADEANLEFMTLLIANKLCILPIYPLVEGSPDYGLYIPPSCLPPFIQAYPRSNLTPFSAQRFMEIVVNMLRSPNLSLSQLPPQTIPVPELQPSIEYLHQITRSPGIFSALLQAGYKNDDYAKGVAPGIAQIAIIAANMDPALDVDNVELEPPAVPGFLEAVAWTLSRLSANEESRDLYHRFVVAASALLIFACRDQGSKEMVAYNPSRTELLRELNENKDTYVGLISEKRWNRLINGLNLVEGSIEELDHEMSDMESAAEVNDGIDEVNGEISHEAQDEVQNEVREEVQEGVRDEVQDEVKDDIARGSNEPVVGGVDSENGAQKSKENMPHASSGSLVPGSGIPPD